MDKVQELQKEEEMKIILTIWFVLSSIADYGTTFLLLNLTPDAEEANWLPRFCLERWGWPGMAICNATLGIFALSIFWWACHKGHRSGIIGLWLVCLFSTAVVLRTLVMLGSI